MTHEPHPFHQSVTDVPGIRCSCGTLIKVGDTYRKPTKRGRVIWTIRTMGQCWDAFRDHWLAQQKGT